MISKGKTKFIRSLGIKKHRTEEGLFVAEGPKVIGDLLKVGYKARMIVGTASILSIVKPFECDEIIEAESSELAKISFLQHPQDILGVFRMPCRGKFPLPGKDTLSLALDGIQDPGNLGTIIRIADWFGIKDLYCSEDTADAYNPKVVQATMGSIAHVSVHYTGLAKLIDSLSPDVPVYGTVLDGDDIYSAALSEGGLIVMGNEGNGISPDIRKRINRNILIPPYSREGMTAESLNVAIATAITCAEFRRRLTQ